MAWPSQPLRKSSSHQPEPLILALEVRRSDAWPAPCDAWPLITLCAPAGQAGSQRYAAAARARVERAWVGAAGATSAWQARLQRRRHGGPGGAAAGLQAPKPCASSYTQCILLYIGSKGRPAAAAPVPQITVGRRRAHQPPAWPAGRRPMPHAALRSESRWFRPRWPWCPAAWAFATPSDLEQGSHGRGSMQLMMCLNREWR
jgi:hypothetical protein